MTVLGSCPDDLFARARASSISVREQEQLDRHIAQCGACRALLLVSRGFEQRLAAQAGDMQALARMVDRVRLARSSGTNVTGAAGALRSSPKARLPRTRLGVLLLAAALTAGVATAARVPATRSFAERLVASFVAPRAAPAVPTATPRPAAPVPSVVEAVSATPVEPAAPEEAAPLAPAATVNERKPATASNPRVRIDEASTAERLFAEANARRKAGDTAGARRLYTELARRYPGSPEAQVSSASLGRLLLERSDDPAGALAQFDRLLARPSASMAQPALAEEALFGRATALMRLGRAKEEKATWVDLLARFPGSVYAERAKERLRALK